VAGWFEAGAAVFFRQTPENHARMKPDFRGGVSFSKGFGHLWRPDLMAALRKPMMTESS
jgi:hypothetical protein